MSRKFRRNVGLVLTLAVLAFMLFSVSAFATSEVYLKGFAKDNKLPYGLTKKAYQFGVEGPYNTAYDRLNNVENVWISNC
ncbi:MAG: hypothetical protein KAX49_13275 [Halanaerobiales bacterium]|nr:hypothetical protein [Halanaerobiales bacterium]